MSRIVYQLNFKSRECLYDEACKLPLHSEERSQALGKLSDRAFSIIREVIYEHHIPVIAVGSQVLVPLDSDGEADYLEVTRTAYDPRTDQHWWTFEIELSDTNSQYDTIEYWTKNGTWELF